MRTKYRINYRFIALLLAVATLLTSFNMLAYALPVVALGEETPITIRNDAMHFFFRHWHTDKDDDSVLNPGEEQGNDQDDYFVVVEGYIMPNTDPKIEGKYVCYAVDQAEATKGTLIPIGDVVDDSPYIEDFEPETGILILKTKLLIDSDPNIDDPVERFAGISISAGHAAVISSDEEFIIIQYKDDIHLVKGHVFYQNKSRIVTGTYDTEAFAATDLFKDEQIDTALAYTYKEDHNDTYGDHKAGDLVMSRANDKQACTDLNDLPNGTTKGDVKLTKFYSTAPGLHTDKTVVQTADGRTFLYDLEAWYAEGYAPQVGLILDASGSMAFALDKPSVINVNKLGLGNRFADKKDFLQEYGAFTREDDLIGYYEFSKNANNDSNTGNYRTWFLNSAKDPYTNYKTTTDFSEAKSGNFAKTVKQPTQTDVQNGNFAFSPSKPVWQPSDFDSIQGGSHTGWGTPPVGFSHTEGYYLTNNNATVGTSGILLDVNPNSPTNFTISFTLQQTGDGACSSDIEILYIGPETVTGPTQKYFHVYRAGNDVVAEYGGQIVAQFSGFGKKGDKHTVSFTFDRDGMTTYWDGDAKGTAVIEGLLAEVVVIAPFDDSNEQLRYFSIDNVYLFNAVLDKDELGDLLEIAGKPFVSVQKSVSAFLTEAELALILNTRKIDNSYLGFADYSYYIYNPASGTSAYCPITYYFNTSADIDYARTTKVNGKGWYYLKCTGNLANDNYKSIVGIPDGASFTDTIVKAKVSNIGAAPDMETIGGNTGLSYTQSGADSPMKFYIDSNGNLRCFFASSEDYVYTSFVYELEDEDYIRTEGLQRVLGSFANTLNDRSPSAQLSAVQFSNNTTDTNGKLLLDWTSDSGRMAELLSLNKGNGKASGHNAYGEYNYTMTGGTNTDKGLAAFRKLLADKDYKHDNIKENDVASRYLILFTDGEYDDAAAADLANQANILKGINKNPDGGDDYDYTIFVVLLTDTVDETQKTRNLAALAGNKDASVTKIENGYGTDPEGKKYYFHISDLDELAHAFMEDIINQVIDDMNGYTIKDYIDPRFDLRSADGTIWHLRADGEVLKRPSNMTLKELQELEKKNPDEYKKYILNISETGGAEFRLSGDTDPAARTPYLRYDAENDMYYLEWKDQVIPTCGVGSDRMEVWIAQVWVRAKEDFIGGNAVLVGGNAEKMNWVYHPSDKDASSGTDDDQKEYKKNEDGEDIPSQVTDRYPSKGFPRAVVNVALLPIYSNPLEDVIYLGEAVSPEQILTEIKDNFMTETYYLEYLKRFAYARYDVGKYRPDLKEQMDRPLLDLLTEWLELDNNEVEVKAFSVPYMYLPAVEWDEETGKIALNPDGSAKTIYNNVGRVETNQRCIVGVLTYRWEQRDPKPMSLYEPVKDYVKTDTDRIIYALTVEFTPLRVGDSYELFYGSNDDNTNGEESEVAEILTTAEGYPIISMLEINGVNVDTSSYAETGIFEKYLRIDDNHKATVQSDTRLDREKYINGNLDENGNIIGEGEAGADHRGSYALISDTAYKWNKDYKPAVGAQELVDVTDLDEYPYGSAGLINNFGDDENPDFRTLKAGTTYAADVVSGGIELEMKVLIGELKEAVDANGDFKYEFTVPVTRSFQDTVFVEELKKTKYTDQNGNSTWEDYGSKFNITFSFDYTATDIAALTKDEDGYVTIYAKTTSIDALSATFKKTSNEETQTQRIDAVSDDKSGEYDLSKSRGLTELPIGTYEIKLNDINDNLPKAIKENLHFATEELGDNLSLEYFQQNVLNGLHTTKNGTGWNGSEKRGDDGKIIEGETYGNGEAEITEGNLDDFRAAGTTASDKALVTFYIGTATPDPKNPDNYKPVRDIVATDNLYIFDKDNYINKRLAMLQLSTGMTVLTVKEEGGLSNESFLYRITGTTLGGKAVNLTVSVQGGDSTTIMIPPGDYTVTEISDWSWRYDNKEPYGLYDDDETLNENWTIVDELTAKVSLRYKDDAEYKDDKGNIVHQTAEEHKTVVYEHERNDKVWLGGENHLDNHFAGVQ